MGHVSKEQMYEWIEKENMEAIKNWVDATDDVDYTYTYVFNRLGDFDESGLDEDDYDVYTAYTEERSTDTALFVAVKLQKPHIAKFLLAHGANPNLQTDCGNNALYEAVEMQNVLLVDLLLKYGADVHMEGPYKKTALMCAVSDVSTINQSEKNQYAFLHPAKKQIKELIINLLLEAGANPNQQVDGFPLTAMEISKQRGDQEIIDLLEISLNKKESK